MFVGLRFPFYWRTAEWVRNYASSGERGREGGTKTDIHHVKLQKTDICHLAAAKVGLNEPTHPPLPPLLLLLLLLLLLFQQWKKRALPRSSSMGRAQRGEQYLLV